MLICSSKLINGSSWFCKMWFFISRVRWIFMIIIIRASKYCSWSRSTYGSFSFYHIRLFTVCSCSMPCLHWRVSYILNSTRFLYFSRMFRFISTFWKIKNYLFLWWIFCYWMQLEIWILMSIGSFVLRLHLFIVFWRMCWRMLTCMSFWLRWIST